MNANSSVRETDRRLPQRGFSLAEILVVVAIIAIMSAFAIPDIMSTINQARVRTAATELSTRIKQTRYQSIKQQLFFRMNIDATGGSYDVEQANTAGTSYTPLNTYTLPPNVSMTAGITQLTFDPRGICTIVTSANNWVDLRSAGSANAKVTYRVGVTTMGSTQVRKL